MINLHFKVKDQLNHIKNQYGVLSDPLSHSLFEEYKPTKLHEKGVERLIACYEEGLERIKAVYKARSKKKLRKQSSKKKKPMQLPSQVVGSNEEVSQIFY